MQTAHSATNLNARDTYASLASNGVSHDSAVRALITAERTGIASLPTVTVIHTGYGPYAEEYDAYDATTATYSIRF